MKNFIFITTLLLSINAFTSESFRVMSFNTTCSVCNKGEFDKYSKRKHWIVDTVKRNAPDLISMQEVLITPQLKWIQKELKDYRLIYFRKYYVLRFADPALFIKTDRFEVKKYGGYWLGPSSRNIFGWTFALPRRLQWTRLLDKTSGREFYFAGSHFDNRKENKNPSAKLFVKSFDHIDIPVILAADTNLKPDLEGYKHITKFYTDTFEAASEIEFVKNADTNKDDSCNLEKGKTFPECRVDHIFTDKKNLWSVQKWGVDQFKYGTNQKFTSDHRAIFADITLY
mgnify:CR=1 FL=1